MDMHAHLLIVLYEMTRSCVSALLSLKQYVEIHLNFNGLFAYGSHH